jgi:aminoglycoside phosphotransferase (APT) family kinase protein
MVDVELDLNVLHDRLAPIGASGLRRLAGGASSLSYVATVDLAGSRRRAVVKVAPAGLEPVRNRDVLRQARLLRRLAETDVPVPQVLWEDAGAPPETPPLFVMSFVDGSSHEPLFDDGDGDPPAVVGERMLDAARVLAVLHAVDPGAIGLDDEPVVGLGDEVGRWMRLLETVDESLVAGWRAVADALLASMPAAMPPAIVHGDFRLGNLLAEGSDVTAIIDWEIWSLADPRIDLGWFLVNADPDTYRRGTAYAGLLPTPVALAGVYAQHAGRDVPDLGWFEALACFKSTATWSLIVKHNRRRTEPDPRAEEIAPSLPRLLERATELLA